MEETLEQATTADAPEETQEQAEQQTEEQATSTTDDNQHDGEAGEATDGDQDNAGEADANDELPEGVKKRLAKITAQKHQERIAKEDAQRRLADLEAQQRQQQPDPQTEQAQQGEPRLEQFETYEQWVSAQSNWAASNAVAQQRREQEQESQRKSQAHEQAKLVETQATFSANAELFAEKTTDYEEVLTTTTSPASIAVQEEILHSEIGPQIAYYLAKNPAEAESIDVMGERDQRRAVMRLEAKLSTTPNKRTANVPKPVPTVGGGAGGAAPDDPGQMDAKSYRAWREAGGGT